MIEMVKTTRISLKTHAELNETWVQDYIAKDPAVLGLGDLELRAKERIHPKAGRLDLLLQDPDSSRRYEVEVQLGPTDESHIIRTIEYWDIERKRFPQYDHCAVIVAEDITSRFLNVISLFNGHIPLIAIQMRAIDLGDGKGTILFTTVLDERPLGLEEEDAEEEPTDRAYWENRASAKALAMVDGLLELARVHDHELELKYNKFYVGLAKGGQPNIFVLFRPKKGFVRLEPRLESSPETQARLEEAGLDVMDYDSRWGRYRIRLQPGDLEKHKTILAEVVAQAYAASGRG